MIRSTMRRAAAVLALATVTFSLSAQSAAEALYRVTLNLYPGDDPAIVAAQLAGTYRGRIDASADAEPGTILLHLSGSGARLLSNDPRVAGVAEIAPNDVGSTWSTGEYDYDGAGNIKTIGTDTFVYDKIGRVLSGTAGTGKSQEYTYDPFGNILSIITDGNVAAQLLPGVEPTTNRITRSNAPYNVFGTYSASGNMTGHAGGTYIYDAVDMVKESTIDGVRKLHLYNADDERIASVTMLADIPQATDWTIRDAGGKVLRRFHKSAQGTWTWVEDYIYRGDSMLAAEVNTPERRRQFHPDHLGTPRLITGGGGAELSRHRYYPFGQEVDPIPASAELKKFTGHERDSANLDYMHARYYKPYWGRFLSVDPKMDLRRIIREPQRWNRYSYVVNNPINKIDPDGREDPAEMVMLGPGSASHWGMSDEEDRESWSKASEWAGTIFAFASGAGEIAGLVRGTARLVTALVPSGTRSLGRWGEARLAQVLGNAGTKPAGAFSTSLGKRFVDRLVNGVAHEAKAGLNVKLTSALEKQMMKDAELVATGQLRGAHWHFFRGVKQEVLDKLKEYGIAYTVHP